jgi:flagellar motor switch protein FliN/FliY
MNDGTTKSPENTMEESAKIVPVGTQGLPPLAPKAGGEAIGLDHLLEVTVPVTVELGHTRITIAILSQLSPGTLIPLDREAHEPVDVLVSGRIIAHGEVVTIGQHYGVRITSVQGA